MKKQYPILSCALWLFIFLAFSCTSTREASVLDRTAVPQVISDVPVGVSEIREVKFNSAGSEIGHEVLHLRGMLFTKSVAGGNTQITACGGCTIRITTPDDTTITANVTTHKDGYFEYNGKILSYTLMLDNPGMNPVVIESVPFQKEGFVTMKIVQAAGSTPERFRITRAGNNYTWEKVQ